RRRRRQLALVLLEFAVRLAMVPRHHPVELRRRQDVARILHSERLENMFLEVLLQCGAAESLHQAAGPVDALSILPTRPRLEHQRVGLAWFGRGLLRSVPEHLAIPDVVTETGRMGEQMAQRNRGPGGTKRRLSVGVESLENIEVGQPRQAP